MGYRVLMSCCNTTVRIGKYPSTLLTNIGKVSLSYQIRRTKINLSTAEFGLLKKLYNQLMEDEKKVLLRILKDLAMLTRMPFKEPKPVIPKGRPSGSKKKLS